MSRSRVALVRVQFSVGNSTIGLVLYFIYYYYDRCKAMLYWLYSVYTRRYSDNHLIYDVTVSAIPKRRFLAVKLSIMRLSVKVTLLPV